MYIYLYMKFVSEYIYILCLRHSNSRNFILPHRLLNEITLVHAHAILLLTMYVFNLFEVATC